jgi:Na+/H+-dicarboxylate symporter
MYTLIRERVASMYELSYVYNLDEMLMPLTLIPILAAIWPAIDPIHTLMNNISDLVGTMLIARQLDKVDMNVYNS